MSDKPFRPSAAADDTLVLKLGGWLQARATGLGVVVLGLIVAAILAAGLARWALG